MAGTAIPRYLVGRNVTVMGGVALYIGADGSITAGSDFSNFHNYGVFDSFEVTFDFGLEEISATDATMENYVQTKASFDCNIGEIQQPSGECKLMDIGFGQSSYIGIEAVVQDPATGTQAELSIVGIFASLKTGFVQGKNVVMANIKPCGIGVYYNVIAGSGGTGTADTTGLSTGNIRTPKVVTNTHP